MNKTFESLVVGDRIFILVITAGQPTVLIKRIIRFEDYSSTRYIILDPKYKLSINKAATFESNFYWKDWYLITCDPTFLIDLLLESSYKGLYRGVVFKLLDFVE